MRRGDGQHKGSVKLRRGQCPPSSGKGCVQEEKTAVNCVCVSTYICMIHACVYVCVCTLCTGEESGCRHYRLILMS